MLVYIQHPKWSEPVLFILFSLPKVTQRVPPTSTTKTSRTTFLARAEPPLLCNFEMPNATDTIEQSQSKHLQQSFRLRKTEKQKNRTTEQTGTITFKHGDLLLRPIQLFHARCRPALLKGDIGKRTLRINVVTKIMLSEGEKKKCCPEK